jgi:hypothetical protein
MDYHDCIIKLIISNETTPLAKFDADQHLRKVHIMFDHASEKKYAIFLMSLVGGGESLFYN